MWQLFIFADALLVNTLTHLQGVTVTQDYIINESAQKDCGK
jgi:hypothetical protein